MDVFDVNRRLIADYDSFTSSLVQVRDARIADHLQADRDHRARWPDPWLSLNPSFESGGTITEHIRLGLLHPECERIFRLKRNEDDPGARPLTLHLHQREAIEAAGTGESYVLTTGTGSGKSMAYIVPIVDSALRDPRPGQIKAIVVYPMNALANSQLHELEKFLTWGIAADGPRVTFARYTGQESDEERERIIARRPDLLLTNYMMLEYLLTRPSERQRLIGAAQGLRFLVLDELHTYRGRQGADVAMLVRRVRDACNSPAMQCVGTSATMATTAVFSETQQIVAAVATRLFGTTVRPERVIGETLRHATGVDAPTSEQLREGIDAALAGGSREYGLLVADPLAGWVEATFGLATEPGTTRFVRQRPTTVAAAADLLAEMTRRPVDQCHLAIKAILQEGANSRDPDSGRPLFAFRLHQFLSKGDTVYVSVEPEDVRHITSQYQVSVPRERDKILLPLAFCRECGQEYLVVARTTTSVGVRYQPRQEQDAAGGEAANGYLYVSFDHPWPDDPLLAGRLPDSWFDTDAHGEPIVLPSREKDLPRDVWLGSDGSERERGEGLRAAYIPGIFRFCLRCRVSYEQTRGQDFAKLATFAVEGRSSAVSLLSTSIIRSLRDQEDLGHEGRKLLAFVDNRQDASLQAGHLNDFVQVTQLRGALYRAAAMAPDGLRHDSVAQQVAEALALPMTAFAQNPEVKFSQRDHVLRALWQALAYRIYADLERGWRVTMPNLEQTGLLRFDYVDLAEVANDSDCWTGTHHLLQGDDPAHRAEITRIVLDEMRRALAVEVDVLSEDGIDRLQRQSDQLLTGTWAVRSDEPRAFARVVFARPAGPGGPRTNVHFTGRSAVGRFLRRPGEFKHATTPPGVDDVQKIIMDLLHVLEKYGFVTVVAEDNSGDRGYRLKASALIWRAGDGRTGAPDPLRKTVDPEVGSRVNEFFRDLYQHRAAQLTGLTAREHTAQVRAEDRQERERDFRDGRLPLLYCSPTMELGVDIATLAAVAMRNVPPTPANYAQRSGRAGRSGQPALVATYCSTGSAHDQYYFRRPEQMVAGSVAPPRLDLTNEDLARSHVHAVWLAETGAHLGTRMTDILDTNGEKPSLELFEHVGSQLADPAARRRASDRARSMLSSLTDELIGSAWWHENWVEDVVRGAAERLRAACDRWRQLYRAALTEREEQHRRVLDNSITPRARDQAKMRRQEAENQLRLLRNDDSEKQYSDFYTYRYLASEGFLPGYAFPRLPLAAYVPGQRQRGSYIQRPRFIAIGEFGPGALIYHEGQRYQVKRVQVPAGAEPGDVATAEARICAACGYWHDRRAGADRCEECDVELGGSLPNLMQLQTVHTVPRRRISSDEEERRRGGFELQTVYQFTAHGPRSGRLYAIIENAAGEPIAELVYGDTATVRVINRGPRRRKNPNDIGFWLDTTKGIWLSEKQAADRAPEEEGLDSYGDAVRVAKVVPYVEDRKNVCVVRLAEPVDDTVAVTLRYALERGVEAAFQLEDVELGSVELPDPQGRARMLFVESAEGGAGVLRRLHDEPDAMARVATAALQIIHIDPATGADIGRAPGARERCERGCYDCLLSYTNQMAHSMIDRHVVVELLRALAAGRSQPAGGGGARSPRDTPGALSEEAGSDLERKLLTFLREGEHRLPDEAQTLVAEARARPDFVYRMPGGPVAVFVDGPHHDQAAVAERDAQAEDRLGDLGWLVVRFRHDDDWAEIVRRCPNVFGGGRGASR